MYTREKLTEQIEKNFLFNTIQGTSNCLIKEYPTWTVNIDNCYGVMIGYNYDVEYVKEFENFKVKTACYRLGNNEEKGILLLCDDDSIKREFAYICADFCYTGNDGTRRKEIIDNIDEFFKKWEALFGNTKKIKKAYSILAELIIMTKLLENKENVSWSGSRMGTHDIETDTFDAEVKSSLKRKETVIDISSIYQLESEKELYIFFVRLEEIIKGGVSINSQIKKLSELGEDVESIERHLKRLGLEKGKDERNKAYKVLEIRKYIVNSKFPGITKFSFKNDKIPSEIKNISYTINLEGIEYESFKI